MSKSTKEKIETITSPAGIARFPRLNEPETEVNGQQLETPRFVVTLRFNEADPGVAEFKARLEEMHEAAVAAAEVKRKADPKRKNKQLVVNPITKTAIDKDGNEVEGHFDVTFKTQAVDKHGNAKTVRMFDARGIPTEVNVGGGSKLKINFTPMGYDTNLGAGLSLYLNAVKVIVHKEYQGGDAASYGFGEDESEEGSAEQNPFNGDDDSAAVDEPEVNPEPVVEKKKVKAPGAKSTTKAAGDF